MLADITLDWLADDKNKQTNPPNKYMEYNVEKNQRYAWISKTALFFSSSLPSSILFLVSYLFIV
jgi:hypothetical protein